MSSAMEPPPPDDGPPAHELRVLAPVRSHDSSPSADGDTSSPGTPPAISGNVSPQSPASPSGVKEKPRVRFNSSAAVKQSPPAPRAGSTEAAAEGSTSLGLQKPRPALSRNPYSYNSVSSDIPDEPLSPEKIKSATEAARRAQALAQDTSEAEIDDSEHGSWGRSSFESEAVTEASYNDYNYQSSYSHLANEVESDAQAAYAAEAEKLLRAHRMNMGNPYGPPAAGISTAFTGGLPADGSSSAQQDSPPRGGIFYQILQTYRNPLVWEEQRRKEKDSLPGSSGTTTPTRRKWYEQSDKDTRSQETLSRLVGASTKLANPNEKKSPVERRKKGHKKTASGRILSMMGAQSGDAKIKIHVANILQRQKYIIRMCRALMLFGAPTHRLEEYLATTAKVLEIDCQFLYIPGCMIISFDDVLTHTTEVKIVRTQQGVNLGKLKDIHTIYKEVLHDVINLDDALIRLDEIISAKDQYSVWLCVLMYGLASTAVSTFFNARAIDMPVIFVLGTFLGVLQLIIAPLSKTYSTVFEVSAAILMTFLSRAIASIDGGSIFCFSALAQSSIAMILPGWLVLSSALELQSKAIVPGSIRMVYAIIYSLFLGYGITVGTALYGAIDPNATTAAECSAPLNPYWNFLFVPLYVFFTTFTVQAKWKQMPVMIAIALIGYIVNFYASKKFKASAPIAYTFGAFTIGILANLYSRLRHGVAAAVLLPAVYVQVPGSLASSGAISSGLQTATSLINDGAASSQDPAYNAIVFNVAASMIQIAIGITVGLFLSALAIYPLGKRRSGLWSL